MIAKTEDLMKATEIGRRLLVEAICTADDQDNVEFFAAAYGFYGPLIDTVLREYDREDRDTLTGRLRPPALKKDLNDCTPSDLEELINYRNDLAEETGVEHSAECREETRVFQILADGMRARGISTVRDIPDGMTFDEMMTPPS
jgi:hypothetical protein